MFCQLPYELQYQIVLQLSLKDMKEFLLSHKVNVGINWSDYFLFHTEVDEKLSDNFGIIDKEFMIEHGRYLINKSSDIIEKYLKIWPKMIALDLTKKDVCYNIDGITFAGLNGSCAMISFGFSLYDQKDVYVIDQLIFPSHYRCDDYYNVTYSTTTIYDDIRSIILKEVITDIHMDIIIQDRIRKTEHISF